MFQTIVSDGGLQSRGETALGFKSISLRPGDVVALLRLQFSLGSKSYSSYAVR